MSLIEKLDNLIADRRWDEAKAKAAKIVHLFPDSPRTDGLIERVTVSRDRYKLELERKFLKAAERVAASVEVQAKRCRAVADDLALALNGHP